MGQTLMQVSHAKHVWGSITTTSSSNAIAVVGQRSTHPPHLTHFSVSIWITEYLLSMAVNGEQ